MKKILLTSIIMSFIAIAPTEAQYMPVIPSATLQAAQQAVIQSTPSSEVVRVGIGTTNFGTYQYGKPKYKNNIKRRDVQYLYPRKYAT